MTKGPFRWSVLVFLGCLLAVNCYRAATQSIVHDEALTWELYLAGPASAIFQYYDANNHFLATLLFRLSTTLFGVSEFSMRLPTLAAGAWFFWTAFRLCRLIAGDGWAFVVGIAALTLNPLLLDLLVAARGYGLAMAGLFWGLYEMLAWFDEHARGVPEDRLRRRLWKAALGLSVAVAANLIMVVPAFVLAVCFCVLLLRTSQAAPAREEPAAKPSVKTRKKPKPPKLRTGQNTSGARRLVHFLAPVAVLAVIFFLAAPLSSARAEDFYVGLNSASASLQNLIASSFTYDYAVADLLRSDLIRHVWMGFGLLFVSLASVAAMAVALFRPLAPERPLHQLAALLSSATVIGSAILLMLAHLAANLPYPQDRTGIYFVPLATLSAVALAQCASGPARKAVIAGLIVIAAGFAAEWNTTSFLAWRYDADTKRIFEALERSPKPPGEVKLGVSWVLEPSINFYREIRQAAWLQLVQRDGFDGTRQFYIVAVEDRQVLRRRHLREIYRGPISGAVLAAP